MESVQTPTPESVVPPDWQTWTEIALPPILATALHHFQGQGYHGTTVRNIAAGAGLTMPTLYYHYGSKEGMLYALLNIAIEDLQAHVDLCLEAAGEDTRQRFENYITTIALHYTHRRDLAMLHSESRSLGEEFSKQYREKRTGFEQTLEHLLEDGIAEGVFDGTEDPSFTARVLLGMLGGILDWYKRTGPLSPAEIARMYTAYALRVVSAP